MGASLSARRAWIEILGCRIYDMSAAVALRKESVDRNLHGCYSLRYPAQSLSARRAWIEIHLIPSSGTLRNVALRKESVDRNGGLVSVVRFASCRSPQGERG